VADVDRRVEVAIETKHPTRYAGLVERRLVALLDEFGWAGGRSPVRVMSFSRCPCAGCAYLAPDLRTVMLFERVPLRFRDGSLPRGSRRRPEHRDRAVTPRYVERAHRHGHPVHVWTVDDAADIALCRELGVEAIITNRPGRVLRALGRETGPAPA
jgi:glycerophosphoryl diester phosphodiesterase